MDIQKTLAENFFRYAAVSSQSNAAASAIPSSEGQRALALLLAKELAELGVVDIRISENAVLTGRLPARGSDSRRRTGFCAHLDTVDVKLSPDIHPVMIRNYDGQDIVRGEGANGILSPKDHPELLNYIGQDIIVSDGTSVLGADNKAAIANIMTALAVLKDEPERRHGELYLCFTPDEETGLRGAKKLEKEFFPVDCAYTIDCCEEGEAVWETFNAGSAVVDIRGVSAHPMSAKNVLVNPVLVATDLINLFDRAATPEHTEGREGYIWITGVNADASHARVSLNIRDHDKKGYEAKKAYIASAVQMIRERHPRATLKLSMEDTYANIADAMKEGESCVEDLLQAMKDVGVTPRPIPMRGGTDGSYFSVIGIPTPNYFTGAHNFHSTAEFMPMGAVEKSCLVTLRLIAMTADK